MSRVMTFIYGGLITYIALDALFLGFIPSEFLSYLVVLMGVLVLMTPQVSPGQLATPVARPWYQKARRWFFGAAMFVMGLASIVPQIEEMLPAFTIYSKAGPFILLGIGVIYFLSAFEKTRSIQMGTF